LDGDIGGLYKPTGVASIFGSGLRMNIDNYEKGSSVTVIIQPKRNNNKLCYAWAQWKKGENMNQKKLKDRALKFDGTKYVGRCKNHVG
jgi:hypothetical protein